MEATMGSAHYATHVENSVWIRMQHDGGEVLFLPEVMGVF